MDLPLHKGRRKKITTSMKHKPQIRAAIYARSALANESEIIRQINASIKAINRNEETLIGVYAESGHSRMTPPYRPEFQRLMKDARKGRFSKLYLRDIDRLSRDFGKLRAALKQLQRNGIAIITDAGPVEVHLASILTSPAHRRRRPPRKGRADQLTR
jgi:DNA invertase Pin-like site-specific DNA recombinase